MQSSTSLTGLLEGVLACPVLWWELGCTAQAGTGSVLMGLPVFFTWCWEPYLVTSQMPAWFSVSSDNKYAISQDRSFPCHSYSWFSELDGTKEFVLSRIVVSGLNFASELLLRTLIYKMDNISCAEGVALPTGPPLSLPYGAPPWIPKTLTQEFGSPLTIRKTCPTLNCSDSGLWKSIV